MRVVAASTQRSHATHWQAGRAADSDPGAPRPQAPLSARLAPLVPSPTPQVLGLSRATRSDACRQPPDGAASRRRGEGGKEPLTPAPACTWLQPEGETPACQVACRAIVAMWHCLPKHQRISAQCGPVGTAERAGSADAGRAGATTAGACGLCVAGSYQTGSGSSRRRSAEECAVTRRLENCFYSCPS